jgi:hypothetical protein
MVVDLGMVEDIGFIRSDKAPALNPCTRKYQVTILTEKQYAPS